MKNQTQWFELGNGVELLRYQPAWDWQKGPQENLSKIQSEDLLSLKFTKPEQLLVAVDTGTKAHSLADGEEAVIMTARVEWVYNYPSVRTIQCVCFETKRMEWYTVELTFGYIAPFEPEIRIKALLAPPTNFGTSVRTMEEALRQCVDGLNSDQIT